LRANKIQIGTKQNRLQSRTSIGSALREQTFNRTLLGAEIIKLHSCLRLSDKRKPPI